MSSSVVSKTVVAQLAKLDSCAVSDAFDKLGLQGVVSGLAAMTIPRRIAGRVRTVKLGAPREDVPKRHLGTATIASSEPGDIIVVEHGRLDISGWGGLLTRAAMRRGVAGVIVDGGFRDLDEARELNFPIYARSSVPRTARGRVSEHAYNVRVTIGGVEVNPGDLVLADGSGVVFIPEGEAARVIEVAREIFEREALMAKAIDSGEAVDRVLGASYEDLLKSVGE